MSVRTDDRDFDAFTRVMIIVRVICVGGALSLVAVLAGTGLETRNALLVTGILLSVFPLSAVWWWVFKSGRARRQLVYAQLVADVGVATGIVYCTGGTQSNLSLLYFVPILTASIVLSMRGALAAATLSAVLYTGVALVGRGQSGAPEVSGAASDAYVMLNAGLQVAFFYFAAVLSGYLSRRMGVFGARLRSTATELRRIRMDTHSIIESMSSGLVVVDSESTVTEFNTAASRMLGVPAGEVVGKKAGEAFGPISQDLDRKITDALSHRRVEERGEARVFTGGREVPLGVSVSLLEDEGTTRGVVLVFQDLTDVKRTTEKARLADRLAALGELSAAIAHEIRTPLASICGSVEMLRDSVETQGENQRLLDLVVKESDRLKSIIDHFLEFARSRPPRLRGVPLNSVLAEVVFMVKNHPAFHGGIAVEIEAHRVVRAWVDEETVKQVFYNLALNAVEALEGGGRLRITLDSAPGQGPGYAVVAFEDDGAGIAEDDLRHVFEPFFTRKPTGTGLGLAISSKIVEEHGGRIELRSNKGQGTVATVYLPLDRSQEPRILCKPETSHVLVDAANRAE